MFILQNRILQHILFWCLSYYYLVHLFSRPDSVEKIDLVYTAMFHLPLILGVYSNLYIFVPFLLDKGRYFLYILCFVGLVILTALCNAMLFNYGIDYLLPGYFFISDHDLYELLQFSFAYIALTTLLRLSRAWFKMLETKNHVMELEKEKINAELLFLKMQINPHFLFNSLNNIYSLALKRDERTPLLLLKLSEVTRYMVYESGEPFVSLRSELGYINNYIEIQRLRMRDDTAIRFEVSGEIEEQEIAPLILIVFIENAFKHGIRSGVEKSFVHIKLDVLGDRLTLEVENSKGVPDHLEDDRFKGLGLENVKRRLDLIYPGKYHLCIEESADKYRAILKLNSLSIRSLNRIVYESKMSDS